MASVMSDLCGHTERRRPMTGTKLYCMVIGGGAQGCNNLFRVVTQPHPDTESNPRPIDRKSDAQPVAPLLIYY